MTSEQSTTIFEASRLLRFALNTRTTVARSIDYQQLLNRYHTDPDMRDAMNTIARGLDLQVFELARDVGLSVVNIADGPYAPNLNDFRSNMRPRERIIYGLIFAMLTAYIYPSRRAIGELDDSSVVSIDLRALVDWASTTSRQMRSMTNIEDVANEDLRAGFETIAITEPFGDGQNTLFYRFRFVLEWLAGHGLFLRNEEGGREFWIARPHFRVQARHLMQSGHDRLIEFLGARRSSAAQS
jgi:hypothetical protein